MTSGWHFQEDATPTPGEVEAMVSVLEGRHGMLGGRRRRLPLDVPQPEGRRGTQLGLGRRGRDGAPPQPRRGSASDAMLDA